MRDKQNIINEMFELFRKYIDENMHLINRENPDIGMICDSCEIAKTTILSSVALVEELSKKMKDIIITNPTMKRNLLRKLEKHILLKYFIDEADTFPYFAVINIINNRIQNGIFICDITDKEIWTKVVRLCIGIMNFTEKREIDIIHELNFNADLSRLVKSAKYLKMNKYNVEISNGDVAIDSNTEKRITSKIESLVVELGGENVIKQIFSNLSNVYNSKQKRYMLTRNASTLPSSDGSQLMPYNYILQLCLKHFSNYNWDKIHKREYQKKLNVLNELLLAFTGVFPFQKSTVYADMFIDIENLPEYIQENIFFDKLFTFRQWNPDYIPELTIGLFEEIFKQNANDGSLGYLFDDYIQLEKALLTLEYTNFNVFTKEKLSERLKLVSDKSLDTLLKKLSHERIGINKDFLTFDSPIDFNQKPLIKTSNNEYTLINPSLCAYAFIDVIESDLRNLVDEFDSILGEHLEAYIKSCLKTKGIEYKTGYYSDNSECDIVIETDKKVVFIEIKKKPLTQKAQNGSDIYFFNDIAKSLLASQVQLGGHELYLIQNGSISLRKYRSKKASKGLPEEQIVYNNRIIERVSLVLQDYGFLHSKIIASNIMSLLTGTEIHAVDPAMESELDDLRRKLKALLEQSEKLIKEVGQKDRVRDIYFDISFRSLQQFLLALDNSTCVDSFVNALLIDKYVSTGSNDYYKDFEYLHKLGKL